MGTCLLLNQFTLEWLVYESPRPAPDATPQGSIVVIDTPPESNRCTMLPSLGAMPIELWPETFQKIFQNG